MHIENAPTNNWKNFSFIVVMKFSEYVEISFDNSLVCANEGCFTKQDWVQVHMPWCRPC